jgi:hypothetical protein
MRYLTPDFLTRNWNPPGFILLVVFPCAVAGDGEKMLRENDLYHIDITPATTRATEHKIFRNFNAYPRIPGYSCSLESG